MRDVADELRAAVAESLPRLSARGDAEAASARAAGQWSRKEILGHLIDSAANNHQRFIRAPLVPELVFPGYQQDEWVRRQRYRDRPWADLVALWRMLNEHVACAMEAISEEDRARILRIGDDPPQSLEWWVRDYVRHLRHHLAQIE